MTQLALCNTLGAVNAPRSRVAKMVTALRRIGGSLWMVDNAFSGAFVDNVGTTPVTAVGDLIGKVSDKTGTNHATQSAVASKPSVQRVPKRLGPELSAYASGFASTAGISGIDATVATASNELVITSTSADGSDRAEIPLTGLVVGRSYTATVVARRGAQGSQQRVRTWTIGTVAATPITSTTSTPYSFTFVATAESGVARVYSQDAAGAVGDSAIVTSLALREVLEWVNVISFDGSNDFLQTGITTGNEGWVCAGVTSNSYAVTKTIFWTGANSPSEAGATLRVLGGGVVQMVTCDGTAQAASSGGANAATGTPQVIEGGWNATTLRAAVDGAEATAPNTRGGASTQTAKIGNAASGQLFNGPMHAIAYTPVLPSAADRATIRNGIAALQGRTL